MAEKPGMEVVCQLPNSCTLYREENGVGGHRYWSDEIGGGVCVWDTCLVGADTLLAAITEENRRSTAARHAAEMEVRDATRNAPQLPAPEADDVEF